MRRILIASTLLAVAVPAVAAGPSLTTRLFVEQAQPGRSLRLTPVPRRLRSGDRIVVVVAVPAGVGARLIQPMPHALRFTGALREPLAVSVDGGLTFGTLAALTVADVRGGERPARADDVTHLRWSLTGTKPTRLSFRAVVR